MKIGNKKKKQACGQYNSMEHPLTLAYRPEKFKHKCYGTVTGGKYRKSSPSGRFSLTGPLPGLPNQM
jgi:hypothetical protein